MDYDCGNKIERAVMADYNRPCLFHVAGPCFHPKCLEAHYETLMRRASEMELEVTMSHPEDFCERCKGPNVVWFAPSPLWNAAHGEWDILCPVCFVQLAEAAGITPTAWRIAPEEHEPQVHEGDRIIYARGSPLDKAVECYGTFVKKLKGEQCRILVDGASYPTDTTDSRVRLAPSALSAQERSMDERTKLRKAQARDVMPLIGPLLDAYEALPNDVRGMEELDGLRVQLGAINTAMEEAE